MPLRRVLEPEVMEDPQEALDYDAMDHRQVNDQFVQDLLEFRSVAGDVLDLGTGTAHIPILLCQAVETCRVMGVDMSVEMLDLARYNVEAASLIERVSLGKQDAKRLTFEDDQFDIVISNSIVHHIPQPREALTEAIRVAKPGGCLFFRDLLRPADEAAVHHLVQTYAGAENEHQQKMFRDSLHAALSLEEMRDLISQLGFDPEQVQATSDRHWTWAALK